LYRIIAELAGREYSDRLSLSDHTLGVTVMHKKQNIKGEKQVKNYILLIFVLAFLLLSGCKGPAGPTGPAGASGTEALTDSSVALKVIWTFPANGQVGPISNLGNEISIRFNKILNVSTVNQSIQISPSNTGYARIDTNNISVPTGDLISFSLLYDSSNVWDIGQIYTITVLSTLKDINGNTLSTPYNFSFTPEPYFRVTYIYPNNGAVGISRNPDVSFEFNNRIDFSSFQASISIFPAISGTWNNVGNYVYLSSSSQLSANTVYTVTLGIGMKDAQGRTLSAPYTFSFTTGQ
jgi:hypothetical protein